MTAGASHASKGVKASAKVHLEMEGGGGGSAGLRYEASAQHSPIVASIEFAGNLPLRAAEVRPCVEQSEVEQSGAECVQNTINFNRFGKAPSKGSEHMHSKGSQRALN